MSAGGLEYTLYFAWVPQGTPWDLSLARFDENIFDLTIEHDEGQIPTATVEIVNPRVGFISPTRLYWAWISFSYEACPPQPLFFGRLVGIPEEISHNTVKVKFLARDPRYVYMKQQIARSLKVAPNYDPVFVGQAKRDDPDTILEGWSALFHVDRIDNRVSASDIVIGEDGTINFATQDVFYNSVQCKLLQPPLVAVNVKATVNWEQQYQGFMYLGSWAWPTLGSDAFVGDWPKSGSGIGGGWSAGVSWAGERDPGIIEAGMLQLQPIQNSYTYSYQNMQKTHQNGDTMSFDFSFTPPFGTTVVLDHDFQVGIVDPFHTDFGGKPAPINIPAKSSWKWFCYRTFALGFLGKESLATLTIVYKADRKRSEQLEMTVTADVQPVLIDPLVTEDTEQITLKSSDLSLPLIDMLNWDSVGMGGRVELGQFIYPDNPLVPGQTSSQICVQAGNTGMQEPVFSNNSGETTVDGTVIWASYGDTAPVEGSQDWVRDARVPLGALLLPRPISGIPNLASAIAPGNLNYPPTGTAVAKFTMYCGSNGGPGDTIYECVQAGMLGGLGGTPIPEPPVLPPPILGLPPDEWPQPPPGPSGAPAPQALFNLFSNPSGMFLYIAVQAGSTGLFHSTFDETPGSQTSDGSVVWQNIGQVTLPIGGWPGMTPAATYFTTDRGQESVQHMLCRARAKLRKRARAVEVSFDTRFEVAAQLSCRMNGSITDLRLPGGAASGKVVSYKIEAHGDTGVLKGSVVLGCSIGTNNISDAAVRGVISLTDPGVPGYVQEGYVQRGYQQYYSSVSGAPSGALPDQGVSFENPPTPPNWPTLPPTLPPETCPPLSSYWSLGPTDEAGDEMSYTPPTYAPNDDGVSFPVGSDAILANQWHGTPTTLNPDNVVLYNLEIQQAIEDAILNEQASRPMRIPGSGLTVTAGGSPIAQIYDLQVAAETAVIQAIMQGEGLWYELVLKPVTNGPFSSYYVINTSDLLVPQTIDLSAPSSGLTRGGLLSHAPRT